MSMSENSRRLHLRYAASNDFGESTWCQKNDGLLKQLLAPHHKAVLMDISLGGFRFITNVKPEDGDEVSFTVTYRNYKPFILVGRVRAARSLGMYFDDETKKSEELFGVSIQLLQSDTPDLDTLHRLMNRLEQAETST